MDWWIIPSCLRQTVLSILRRLARCSLQPEYKYKLYNQSLCELFFNSNPVIFIIELFVNNISLICANVWNIYPYNVNYGWSWWSWCWWECPRFHEYHHGQSRREKLDPPIHASLMNYSSFQTFLAAPPLSKPLLFPPNLTNLVQPYLTRQPNST